MSFKKYQEYFVKVLFIENIAKNFNDIIREFSKNYKNNFISTQKEVNDIKYLTIGKNNNLDFFQLCNTLKIDDNKKLEVTEITQNYSLINYINFKIF